jgi:PAS domain S-box-containing protein
MIPIGYLPVLCFIFIATKTILRYRLVDITPEFAAGKIIDTMRDALFVFDHEGIIKVVNHSAAHLFNSSRDDLLGRPWREVIDDKGFSDRIDALGRDGIIRNYELSYTDKNGETAFLSMSATVMPGKDGEPVATVCIARDITDIKKVEEELRKHRDHLEELVETRTIELRNANRLLTQEIVERLSIEEKLKHSYEELRNLSAHLQNIREEERTRIAREIHDELGQLLTALKMDMVWLNKRLTGKHKRESDKIRTMVKLVEMSIQTVQRISSELRPGILDHLGLTAAVEWQAGEFRKRSGINYEIKISLDDSMLDRDLSTTVFRIFQEALTNVIRHAGATRVVITMVELDGFIELEIEDNGRGITEEEIHDPKSFGIIGVDYRDQGEGKLLGW